ncbi:hypothetical protein NDU88_005683 [Pleurodeles waltl]|uniref:Uncharacterized protein n=1 Tax=Pleurodeles waltl TaxID=8319 RepID=A0AAV7NSY9_PLEWA|nr:hypothetical protein NDU88_005683 [Pleurodeles waltl]
MSPRLAPTSPLVQDSCCTIRWSPDVALLAAIIRAASLHQASITQSRWAPNFMLHLWGAAQNEQAQLEGVDPNFSTSCSVGMTEMKRRTHWWQAEISVPIALTTEIPVPTVDITAYIIEVEKFGMKVE